MNSIIKKNLQNGELLHEEVQLLAQLYFELMEICKPYKEKLDGDEYIDDLFHQINAKVQSYDSLVLEVSEDASLKFKTTLTNYYYSERMKYEEEKHMLHPLQWLSTHYNSHFSGEVAQFINGKGRLYGNDLKVWKFYKMNDKDSCEFIVTRLSRKGLDLSVIYLESVVGRSLKVDEISYLLSTLFDADICELEGDTILIPENYDSNKPILVYETCLNSGINRYKTHQKQIVNSKKFNTIIKQKLQDMSEVDYNIFFDFTEQGIQKKWIVDEAREHYQSLLSMKNQVNRLTENFKNEF